MSPAPHTRIESAFAHHEAAIRAVPPEQALAPRLDVSRAASVLLAALPRIEAALPALADLARGEGPLVLELPDRILALVHAEALHGISQPTNVAATWLPAARTLRGHLLRHARIHTFGGPIPAIALAPLGASRGAVSVGMSLLQLAELYRHHWDALAGRTAVTLAEIAEAQDLGTRLYASREERRRPERASPAARLLRAQAYTYFRASYDPARRAAVYQHGRVRADEVVPNVFDRWGAGR